MRMRKEVSRTELAMCIYRMTKALVDERTIIEMFLDQLYHVHFGASPKSGAKYKQRLREAKTEADRDHVLKVAWHGTVGNYYMAVVKMPSNLQQQFWLTQAKWDKTLHPAEKIELLVTRLVMNYCASYRKKAIDAGDWNPLNGGPTFMTSYNLMIADKNMNCVAK